MSNCMAFYESSVTFVRTERKGVILVYPQRIFLPEFTHFLTGLANICHRFPSLKSVLIRCISCSFVEPCPIS